MPMDWGLARDYAARDGYPEETPLTEAEWLAETDPRTLFLFRGSRQSGRKMRLLAVACCRRFACLLSEEARELLEVAERVAEGTAAPGERQRALGRAYAVALVSDRSAARRRGLAKAAVIETLQHNVHLAAGNAVWRTLRIGGMEKARAAGSLEAGLVAHGIEQAALVREVIGNPFRSTPTIDPAWHAWRDGTVPQLAKAAYEERRSPEGTLETARLALLADALEDAGCTDAELLAHLRSSGPHVRGCWAVDFVLGKS
jgi:hypothetical protein